MKFTKGQRISPPDEANIVVIDVDATIRETGNAEAGSRARILHSVTYQNTETGETGTVHITPKP